MNYEHLLYKRGYLFSQAKVQPPIPAWTQKTIGDYFISFDPENPWAFSQEGGSWVALLGRAIDTRHWTTDTSVMANRCLDFLTYSEEKMLDYIDHLSGRFILIYHNKGSTKFMNDAFGTRSAFYCLQEPVMIASHCGIISDSLKSSQSMQIATIKRDDRWRTGSHFGYPGNLTPFKGIYILTPNTLIKIEERKIKRFYPRRELPAGNLSDVIEEVSAILQHELELLHHKYNLAISLSAGIDSRTTLAAAREIAKKVLFFTYGPRLVYGTDISAASTISSEAIALMPAHQQQSIQTDLLVASEMAQALELRHICLNDAVSQEDLRHFNQVMDRKRYLSHAKKVAKAYLDKLPPNILHISSHLGGIAKAYYRRHGFNTLPLTAKTMSQCWKPRMQDNEVVVNAYHQFALVTEFADIMNYDPYDMFYWEHFYGTWYSYVLLESDVAFDSFELLNNRSIVEKILSAPIQDRIASAVHLTIIRRLWPLLMQWPINQMPYEIQLKDLRAKHATLKAEQESLITQLNVIREQVDRSKTERYKLKKELLTVKRSFSYQLGQLLVQAVRNPGRNTLLLPYDIARLVGRRMKTTSSNKKATSLSTNKSRILEEIR